MEDLSEIVDQFRCYRSLGIHWSSVFITAEVVRSRLHACGINKHVEKKRLRLELVPVDRKTTSFLVREEMGNTLRILTCLTHKNASDIMRLERIDCV